MRLTKHMLALFIFSFFTLSFVGNDNDASVKSANQKIKELQQLVRKAKKKKIDTNREECTLWMAETFLGYAQWDEENPELNAYQYSVWKNYKDKADSLAAALPSFERSEINKMLDFSIQEIKDVLAGEIVRRPVPKTNWESITLEGDQFVTDGRPVYINDYFTKPEELQNDYCGKVDRVSLALNTIENFDGKLSSTGVNKIANKSEKYSGYVLLWHGKAPSWLREIDADVDKGYRHFTHYDIDNPNIRKAWSKTFEATIPLLKGKNFTDQGYILSNEPHWFTMEKVWATGELSDYSIEKFEEWLESKHKSISTLNSIWGTYYKSFDEINFQIPFPADLRGKPAGYDWMKFNQERVTEWFSFLKDGILKYDPTAKIHIKLIPRMFRQDIRDHGLDLEKLSVLSDILGNDAKITGRLVNSKNAEYWEEHFSFNWMDVGIAYDFMESVAPDRANINSESHYLSSTGYRDIALTKEFTRSSYWLATLQGMSLNYTWFWAREMDNGIRKDLRVGNNWDNAMTNSYVASVAQQPRVADELAKTFMDLNAFSHEIAAFQRLARPARIFYSETASINDKKYMEKMIGLYTPLFFEGNQVGFATQDVINNQNNRDWGLIMVRETASVLESEIKALQSYLDNGGTIIIDNKSLLTDEYGRKHKLQLHESKGKLIKLSSIDQYIAKSQELLSKSGMLPAIVLQETNSNDAKGCLWRVIETQDGGYMVNIINIGNSEATLNISRRDGKEINSITDEFTGKKLNKEFKIKVQEVVMIEIK